MKFKNIVNKNRWLAFAIGIISGTTIGLFINSKKGAKIVADFSRNTKRLVAKIKKKEKEHIDDEFDIYNENIIG